jgi:putative phosphoesterase
MRVAVVSDIHGNLTALQAAVDDLDMVRPDLVITAGDLVGSGPRPAEVVDLVMELGWPGVIGNTDEVLWNRQPLLDLAARLPALEKTWSLVSEDVAWTRQAIGDKRMQWLRGLPKAWQGEGLAVVHASPGDTWKAPLPTAPDDELERTYSGLRSPIVAYGHLHVPYIRQLAEFTVANSGSVGMPYDGDLRASYLLIDGVQPTVRRVEYDVETEIKELAASGRPNHEWVALNLRAGRYHAP